MTEDVITGLSKRSGLFVIARNSVFAYKGQAVKPQQVSREFGVRYVLEGSVRKAGKRVRITAQLIDANTGYHLWAENYDGELKDVFALQDSITLQIVMALAPKLTTEEHSRSGRQETNSIEAYDHFLRGFSLFYEYGKESNAMARQMFGRAIALDPNYPPWLVFHLAQSYYQLRRYDDAIATLQDALRRNPDFSPARRLLAVVYAELGREKEARADVAEILRISPGASLEQWRERMPYRDQGALERYIAGLRKAGLKRTARSLRARAAYYPTVVVSRPKTVIRERVAW